VLCPDLYNLWRKYVNVKISGVDEEFGKIAGVNMEKNLSTNIHYDIL